MNFKIILLFLIIGLLFLSIKPKQNQTNANFKVVIQTHRNYKSHLDKLLNSIDYKNHLNDIILVYSDEKVYKVENKPRLPSIYSKLNLWEYTSFIEVDNNKHLDNFNSNYYFFVHDTCWCDNHQKFWKNLEYIARNTNDFYYPSSHIKKNIGMCSKFFLTKYSNELKQYGNFDKETAVKLEHMIKNQCAYQNIRGHYKLLGKRQIDNKSRNVHLFSFINLYKHCAINANNNQVNAFHKK